MTATHRPAERPEPVLAAGKLAGAVSAAVLAAGGLLKALGLVVPVDVEELADRAADVVIAAGLGWAVVGPWLTARLRARDQVTPLVDARDKHGMPLYSNEELDRLIAAAHTSALEQARDEYHAALTRPVPDDPGHHSTDRPRGTR